MWETGRACTNVNECTTYPGSVCDSGLCSLGGTTTDTTDATFAPVATTTGAVSSDPGYVITCADNSVTNAARRAVLDEHNRLRSSVAQGLEDDPLIGKAPKASRMLKMIYDCEVEASAIRHAKNCVFQHSASSERPGLGENLCLIIHTTYQLITFAQPFRTCIKTETILQKISLKMTSPRFLVLILTTALADAAVFRHKRAAYSCSNTGLTDALRDVFLGYHNEARLRVARGIEPNNVGYLNPAKNMYKLQWDCTMEQQAQDAIATCPSSLGSWSNMGQNLIRWSSSAGFPNPAAQINSSLANWWGKAKQYGVSDPDNKYTSGNLYSFANMVFAETTKIGCAYKACGNYLTITCLYNAVAYYTNGIMWQTGTACASASECTTYANSVCSAGLCNKGAEVPESNNQCTTNAGMTDSVRQTFLTIHNNYRSSVARGLEPDALGGYAPKASKMLKMVYDCNVEASAMKHAQKCVYQHSASTDRPGLGENLYMTTALNFDKNKAATQASQMWWSELAEYGVGLSNNLTLALWNRANTQIGHYTQMAWETSYKLGCAVVHCSTFTYGVCQYGPAGNYINRLIYTMGNPCTSDAGCPGSYTCSVAEGLCNVV